MLMNQECSLWYPFNWVSNIYFLAKLVVNFKLKKLVLFLTRTNYSKNKKLIKNVLENTLTNICAFIRKWTPFNQRSTSLRRTRTCSEHIQGSPNLNPTGTCAYLTPVIVDLLSQEPFSTCVGTKSSRLQFFQLGPLVATHDTFNPKLSANQSVVCEMEC